MKLKTRIGGVDVELLLSATEGEPCQLSLCHGAETIYLPAENLHAWLTSVLKPRKPLGRPRKPLPDIRPLMQKYRTYAEVARRLGVSRRTIERTWLEALRADMAGKVAG